MLKEKRAACCGPAANGSSEQSFADKCLPQSQAAAVEQHPDMNRTGVHRGHCQYYSHSRSCRYGKGCRLKHQYQGSSTKQRSKDTWYGERQWVLSKYEDAGVAQLRFSVASYNILADKYACNYAASLYREVPPTHLEWPQRRASIVQELSHWRPDIICLQEVDHFDQLQSDLGALGYQGYYLQRPGDRTDGCATFWRTAAFVATAVQPVDYGHWQLGDNVALLMVLEPVASVAAHGTAEAREAAELARLSLDAEAELSPPGAQEHAGDGGSSSGWCDDRAPQPTGSYCRLVVANTHIMFSPQKGHIKTGQARVLMEQVQQLVHRSAASYADANQSKASADSRGHVTATAANATSRQPSPWPAASPAAARNAGSSTPAAAAPPVFAIVTGDFNTTPSSALYSFLRYGSLDLGTVNCRMMGGRLTSGGFRGYREMRARERAQQAAQREQQHIEAQLRRQMKHLNGLGGPGARTGSEPGQHCGSGGCAGEQQQPVAAAPAAHASAPASIAVADERWAGAAPQTSGQQDSNDSDDCDGQPQPSTNGYSHPHPAAPAANGDSRSPAGKWSRRFSTAGHRHKERKRSLSFNGSSMPQDNSQQSKKNRSRDGPPSSHPVPDSGGGDGGGSGSSSGVDRSHSNGFQLLPQLSLPGSHGWRWADLEKAMGSSHDPWPGLAQLSGPSHMPPGAFVARHPLDVVSSYADVTGGEPEFTSAHSGYMGACDYIFFTPSSFAPAATADNRWGHDRAADSRHSNSQCAGDLTLRPIAVLSPPNHNKLRTGLPAASFGSDHLCMVADFVITRRE